MLRSIFSRGAFAGASTFAIFSAATAQEALPTIDIGATRPAAATGAQGDSKASLRSGGRVTGYNVAGPVASTKTNIPILQTPYAVQTVTRETMDDRQEISVKDALTDNISSVAIGLQFYDQFIIRGLSAGEVSYRNGLRQAASTNIETVNLQAIEVLKGPAAMLYGRVEPGGMVNFVPKRPQTIPYHSIQEQAGSFGHTRTTLDATGPLTEDKTLAYRVNLGYTHKNSFRDFANTDNFLIAPTISWRPTERFTLNIDGEYQRADWVDDLGDQGIPAVGRRPANIPIARYLEEAAITTKYRNGQDRALFAYDWTYEFADDWSVTNRLAYASTDYRQRITGGSSLDETTGNMSSYLYILPGLYSPNINPRIYNRSTLSTNIDIKGKFETGPVTHKVLVGFDYFDYHLNSSGICCPNATSTPINIYAPIYSIGNLTNIPIVDNHAGVQRDKWRGIYAQDQISFLEDRVHILLSGRHDWAESSARFGFGRQSLEFLDNTRVVSTTSANSPMAGVLIQPLPWLSIYGNYTRSYGINNATATGQNAALPPQIGTQYEGGVKAELLDKRLTATFAYFDIFKQNIVRPVAGTPFGRPVGEAESRGVEFDLTGRIDDNWSVVANYSHIDVRFTKDRLVNSRVGKRLASVPRNAGNLWLKYEALGDLRGLGVGAGVHYEDIRPGDDDNTFELPAYARVDMMAAYKFKPLWLPFAPDLTFQVNVKNLLGTTYYEGSTHRFNIAPGAPRAFLASVRAEF
jgi:iron complex outermembrane receptor protein